MSPLVRSCSNKRRYATRNEVERYLKYGHTWRPAPGAVARAYRCIFCMGFHLSSARKGARRR
jgi:hypothetical protein